MYNALLHSGRPIIYMRLHAYKNIFINIKLHSIIVLDFSMKTVSFIETRFRVHPIHLH